MWSKLLYPGVKIKSVQFPDCFDGRFQAMKSLVLLPLLAHEWKGSPSGIVLWQTTRSYAGSASSVFEARNCFVRISKRMVSLWMVVSPNIVPIPVSNVTGHLLCQALTKNQKPRRSSRSKIFQMWTLLSLSLHPALPTEPIELLQRQGPPFFSSVLDQRDWWV